MNAANVEFENDTSPVPPARPGTDDCCRGARDPCIFDVYEDALERYRADLRAWQERKKFREKNR